MTVPWSGGSGHQFHSGRESNSAFVAGDSVDVSHGYASLQFEGLAQGSDGVGVGIEDFILLIRRQCTLGRDRGSRSGSKHLSSALGEESLAERILTAAVAVIRDVQTGHELLAFTVAERHASTSFDEFGNKTKGRIELTFSNDDRRRVGQRQRYPRMS